MTQPTDPSLPPSPQSPSQNIPPDQEVVYFEGRPLLRAAQAKATFWLLVGIALIALPIIAYVMDWNWHWALTVLCVIAAILAIGLPWLVLRATRYRITNFRINFERGILKKRIDTLELWHVNDIQFEQGLVDRMMNVGNITVFSSDKTTPKLELEGIPNPRAVFDSLQQRVIVVKRQRGVIKMDVG